MSWKKNIESFKNIPTPFYFYDMELLRATLQNVKDESGKYGYDVHYAFKANTNNEILNLIREFGLGADCVSGNEIRKARELNFSSEKIVFAGVGKSDDEINYALSQDIFCFNCESVQEVEVLNDLAKAQNKTARIALRINPNVKANTHHYITTGLEENKFGISTSQLNEVVDLVLKCKNIELVGMHFHIGSQITDLNSFKSLVIRINELQKFFSDKNIELKHINAGGGLGIDYHHPDQHPIPDFKNYFKVYNDFLELAPGQQLHFELGRAIVGQCGNLISKVLYVKNGVNVDFLIIDAGMTELMRPALYQAFHLIENISSVEKDLHNYDVVGPICESSDCFGKRISLPYSKRGDIIAIRSAGAYGEVMASNYNLRGKVRAVYSKSSNLI
jgi:diaminopimelate decarboxylase